MKNIVVFAILCMAFLTPRYSTAQIQRCHTFESSQDFRLKNPNAETDAQFESWLTKKLTVKSLTTARTLATTYTIPVIFHIVHNGEAVGTGSNLSAARIKQQLDQLNRDFANQSGSSYAVAANMDIQFCLAVVGKDGKALAEPGIERINRNSKGWLAPPYDASTSDSYVDEVIMPQTIWDPYQYLNIWVLHIDETYLIGKATFPSSSLPGTFTNETDTHAGVMVHYKSVGSVSSPGGFGSSYGLGRTLTHEMGHAFGLRHIWGDAACGTDYCNDTPPQKEETVGCPAAGELNGCSPLVPKMFENYMDYTSDNCVNTFTTDQKSRMLAVVQNSPRRKELIQSATCTIPGANTVRFGQVYRAVTEDATTTAVCPRYRDVVVPLNVYGAATDEATINFSNSGTATEGVDYTIIPSTVMFTKDDASAKSITIRIFDDAAVEAPETIVLNYTIEGTGVTAGLGAQTFTLDISDNDRELVINAAAAYPLLNENFGTSGGTWPAGWSWGSFINPAGKNQWVVSSNGGTNFSGQSAHITNDVTTRPNRFDPASASDVLLISKPISAQGYSGLQLSFQFKCNGQYVSSAQYAYGTLMYSTDGYYFDYLTDPEGYIYLLQGYPNAVIANGIELPAVLNNTTFYLGFRWLNKNATAADPGLTIDDVKITGTATLVESRAGQTGSETIMAGQDVYITNTTADAVIARIRNASRNLDCISATVAQAGNGTVAVNTTMGSFTRTQKVIQISPAQPDATTSYDLTLYFTEAELAAWGVNKDKLKILKVKDGADLSKTLTSAHAEVVSPTAVEVNTAGGYIAYTGHFTGFSQFMLVSPNFVLPVQWITFEARPAESHIDLAWKTGAEKDNKGFAVERSLDGHRFAAIGWVDAGTTSSKPHSYTFADHQVVPHTTYYYRLKQVDNNGAYEYSGVRQARIAGSGITLKVVPNPVQDWLKMHLSGVKAPADMQLVDARGQVVGRWKNVNTTAQVFEIPMQHLPSGIYSLVVVWPEGIRTQKVIKQ